MSLCVCNSMILFSLALNIVEHGYVLTCHKTERVFTGGSGDRNRAALI